MFRCTPHSPPPTAASQPELVKNGQPQLVKNGRTQAWGVGSNAPAADTAVSSRFYTGQKRLQRMLHPLCGAMWYGVAALRERRRATALGRQIESNESNQRIRPARTAVPTCQTVYLQHIQIYQCFTTLLCSCL